MASDNTEGYFARGLCIFYIYKNHIGAINWETLFDPWSSHKGGGRLKPHQEMFLDRRALVTFGGFALVPLRWDDYERLSISETLCG
jgi:hypothetical protein